MNMMSADTLTEGERHRERNFVKTLGAIAFKVQSICSPGANVDEALV